MARKFLYLIAAIILLIFGAGIAYQMFPGWLARTAFVPSTEFQPQPVAPPTGYDNEIMWLARPGMKDDPSLWRPTPADGSSENTRQAVTPGAESLAAAVQTGPASPQAHAAEASTPAQAETLPPAQPPVDQGNAAVFFLHPTSYYSRSHWNAPLADRDADHRASLFVRGMGSAFSDAGEVWAPRYRQATLGAFLAEERATADQAIDVAYRDTLQAFEAFLKAIPKNKPIILAGHSQGALHLTTLLRTRIAGTPVAKRIVAAYVIGWPISMETDIAALGLPACDDPDQKNCIVSYLTFAEPADPKMVQDAYDGTTGFDGRPRKDTPMMCTNPITGTLNAAAPAADNIGTLRPSQDFRSGQLFAGVIGARCDSARGLLMLGQASIAKDYVVSGYVLPGNNYHVYDMTLFWSNLRADSLRRLASFEGKGKAKAKAQLGLRSAKAPAA